MRKSIFAMAGAMLLTAALAVPALAAPFENGSFENGTMNDAASCSNTGNPTTGYQIIGDGYCDAKTIPSWIVTQGNVDWKGSYWQAALGGSLSIDLVGRAVGAISQDIDTIAGKSYFVTFMMAGNPGYQGVHELKVSAAANTQNHTFNAAGKSRTNMGWEPRDFVFEATEGTTRLTFEALINRSNGGPAIDAVTVTQIASGGEDCKKDGWMTVIDSLGNPYNFKNQGDCVSFFATGEKNLANPRDDA